MNNHLSPSTAFKLFQLTCFFLLIFAVVWWLAVLPSLSQPVQLLLDVSDWPINGGYAELSREVRFLSAIGSGLLAALALFLLLVVLPEVRKGNFAVLRGTLIAVLAWYIVDTAGCIILGIYSNAILNTVYLSAILVPMYLIRQTREH